MNWLITQSLTKIDLDSIRPEDIKIEDIAHSLAHQCRWGGHCPKFYSVAQHCVHAAEICRTAKLWALMHDAAEAYVSDLPFPVKERFPDFKRLEDQVHEKIAIRFNLHWPMPRLIKAIDLILYRTEVRDLFGDRFRWEPLDGITPWSETLVPWSPDRAKEEFLKTFNELTR